MDYTRDQLLQAAKLASSQGNMDMARQISQRIMDMDAQESKPYEMSDEDQEIFGGMTDGAGEEFIVGVGKGFTDVGRGAQDLWYRITGNDDALSELTKKADEEDAMFQRDLGDSGWATAGEITGEIAATLPVGMGAAGLLGRAGLAANSTRVAMLDGALSEGITQRGGVVERGKAAGMGTLGGAVGNEAMKAVAPRVAKLRARGRSRIKELTEQAGLGDEAAARVTRAADDGGYTLDAAQATQQTDALYRRDALVRDNPDAASMAQQQEKDILAKADEFLARVGGYRDPMDMPKDTRSKAAAGMARALRSLKDADDAEVDKFYREWREAMGDEPIPVIGLREAAEAPFANVTRAVRDEVGEQVRGIFDDYFLGDLDKGARLLDSSGNPFGARTSSLTVGNFEKVQQELNALYRRTSNGDTRQFLGQVKDSLNEHVSLSFQRISDEGTATLNKGRKATEAYKENLKKWSRDDIVTKSTEMKADGIEFRTNPKSSLDAMLRPGNEGTLRKVKDRMALSKDPSVRQSWNQMQQVPLVEAIEAARKAGGANAGNEAFSAKAFMRELGKYNSETLEALWGPKMLGDVKKAAQAWDLKDAKSAMQMQGRKQNPSGSALVLHSTMQAGVRVGAALSRIPMVGQFLLAVPATANVVSGVWGKWKTKVDVERLASGQLPTTVEKELKEAAKQIFSKEVYDAYPDSVVYMTREAIREYAQHNNDNE